MNSAKKVVLIAAGVLVTALAGYSFRIEIDYSKQLKTASRTSSGNLTGDHEQYQTSFHVETESQIGDAQPHGTKGAGAISEMEMRLTAIKPDQSPSPSQLLIIIQSGPSSNDTNNVHIGDIINLIHDDITPHYLNEVPARPTAIQQAPASPPRLDERCAQLQRRHRETLRKWQAFLNDGGLDGELFSLQLNFAGG